MSISRARGLTGWTIRGSIALRGRRIFVCSLLRKRLWGPTFLLFSWYRKLILRSCKAVGGETDLLSPFSGEIKYECNHTSNFLYAFMSWTACLHRKLAGLELVVYARCGTGKMRLFALARIMDDCSFHDVLLLVESM